MKTILEHIRNRVVNEMRLKPVHTTLGEYVAWYIANTNNMDEVDYEDFTSTDFDTYSLDKYFNGDYKKQYDFIIDNADEDIIVRQVETMGGYEASFKVGKINFYPVSMDEFVGFNDNQW